MQQQQELNNEQLVNKMFCMRWCESHHYGGRDQHSNDCNVW
jgi:hypothetical protein